MAWDEKDLKGESSFEYQFDITKSYCGRTEYNSGKTCLVILEGERIGQDKVRKEHHLWFPMNKWEEANAEGTRLLHETGDPERRLERQSKYYKFLNSAIEAGVPVQERGTDSLDVTIWAGLSLRVSEEAREGKIQGEKREWRDFYVTEFLGVLAGSDTGNGTDVEQLEALANEMKQAGKDQLDFIEEAKKRCGVNADDPRLTAVWG